MSLGIESYWGFLPEEPFVSEVTNFWDISQKTILSDYVLVKHLKHRSRDFSGTLLAEHSEWILSLFPELQNIRTDELLNRPFTLDDILKKAENVGTVEEARLINDGWLRKGNHIAYLTGGLEFTKAHHAVAAYLRERDFKLLIGVEPCSHPQEFRKNRPPLAHHVVPISLWSKFLSEHGFVFQVPRPLPGYGNAPSNAIDAFYDSLYREITSGEAYIVVSEADRFKELKRKRGKVIEIPKFEYPSTSEILNNI